MAYPTLKPNEAVGALYNQIISITTEASLIAGVYGELMSSMKVEGGMFGDTRLVIETQVLESKEWDGSNHNILETNRPANPDTQEFVIDRFRQCFVTIDDYLTKRAFADEGTFAQFNGVVRGLVAETKRIYEATTFNAFIGTTKSSVVSDIQVDAEDYPSLAQGIAEKVADTLVELSDVSPDFNDLGYLRSYDLNDIIIVWNADYVNRVKSIDLPALFHKDGLIAKFEQYVLPAKYFGDVNTASKTTADANTRALEECSIDVEESGVVTSHHHYFAGQKITAGDVIASGGEVVVKTYQVNPKYICKIMAKNSVPYMSSFTVGTSFFNDRALDENQYLTWSHNTLAYRKGKPFLTLKDVTAVTE